MATKKTTAPSGNMSAARRESLSREMFAFPRERKEPLNDATHVRDAIARFNQVHGVSDAERDAAWRRIRRAARDFDVDIEIRGWRQLAHHGKRAR